MLSLSSHRCGVCIYVDCQLTATTLWWSQMISNVFFFTLINSSCHELNSYHLHEWVWSVNLKSVCEWTASRQHLKSIDKTKRSSQNVCDCVDIGCFNTFLHLVEMELFILETESCAWARTNNIHRQYWSHFHIYGSLGRRCCQLVQVSKWTFFKRFLVSIFKCKCSK